MSIQRLVTITIDVPWADNPRIAQEHREEAIKQALITHQNEIPFDINAWDRQQIVNRSSICCI